MNTFVTIILAMLALSGSSEASAVFAAAPAILPAAPAIGYAHAVPQNVPPFASRLDIESRVRAAPLIGLPAAPLGFHAPLAPVAPIAAFASPFAPAAPFTAYPAAIAPPLAAAPPFFAPPYPYAPISAPLLRR